MSISAAGGGIQVARGLVGQQHRRINAERAGDGHALALAAGKFIGQVIQADVELHQIQQFIRARLDLLARPAAQMQRQGNIFETRKRGQQVEELEDESDLVAAHTGQIIVVQRELSAAPSDLDFARRWARSRPPIRFSSVDFPEPEGPTMEAISPRAMVRSMRVQRRYLPLAVKLFGNAPEQDHLLP